MMESKKNPSHNWQEPKFGIVLKEQHVVDLYGIINKGLWFSNGEGDQMDEEIVGMVVQAKNRSESTVIT